MSDLPLALLIAVVFAFLVIEVTAGMARDHLGVALPGRLRYGARPRQVPRRALILEIPLVVALFGGGELVVLVMLLDPASSLIVRLVAATQLVIMIAWAWYLRGLIATRGEDPPRAGSSAQRRRDRPGAARDEPR